MLNNFKVFEQSETVTAVTYTVKPTLTFTDKDLEDEATMEFFRMCGGELPTDAVPEVQEDVAEVSPMTEGDGYFQN